MEYSDFAIGDIAKFLKISRPKTYEVIKEFEKKGYVKKSRIVGKTQLYKLNKENKRVKLFLKDFKECLRIVVEEELKKQKKKSKKSSIEFSSNIGTISAKNS